MWRVYTFHFSLAKNNVTKFSQYRKYWVSTSTPNIESLSNEYYAVLPVSVIFEDTKLRQCANRQFIQNLC